MGSSYGWGDSVATADYNNDGFVDLFVTNRRDSMDYENGHNQLYHNGGNNNNWIEIDLEGVVSNRDGIGTLLLVSTGGIHRVSQNHQRIHFGLAKNTTVERLTIYWPSSIIQEINNITANQIIKITELDFIGSSASGSVPLTVTFTMNKRGHYKA